MQRKLMLALPAVLCCIALLASGSVQAQPQPAQYSLPWYVVAGGGAMGMTDGGQTMGMTAGQTAIGPAEDGNDLGAGFWYGTWLGPVGEIYLPLVVRVYTAP